jgi:hypothetical protein
MKTINLFLKAVVGALIILTVAACSKDKGSNNNPYGYGYNNGQYVMQNGICVSRINGQQVQPQLCQQYGGGGMYTMDQYGRCVQTQTGQQVDPSLCYQNGGQWGGGQWGGGGLCYGRCYNQMGQSGTCNGYDCTGMYLYCESTYQWQICR